LPSIVKQKPLVSVKNSQIKNLKLKEEKEKNGDEKRRKNDFLERYHC